MYMEYTMNCFLRMKMQFPQQTALTLHRVLQKINVLFIFTLSEKGWAKSTLTLP